MTKKRKRQDDFQKVKLKVGKKKPKLQNATPTNFKTKTIHLPEQLKEDGTLPTNNRKLNIKVNRKSCFDEIRFSLESCRMLYFCENLSKVLNSLPRIIGFIDVWSFSFTQI